ncbi:hypothetical protein BJ170DRAFT_370712 [Xylariales sp. AK1849]|nr:hypothetical protein BJ170DRAFT_370712 [Xylariales sp. AK1849]
MSGPPPPPPPHGENPKTTNSNLPPGKYDIFIIPPHSSGSGFLYLPSLQPNVNSFAAGFASALVLVVLGHSMAPAFKAWWNNFQGMGNVGMMLLVIGVAVGAWALGRTQQEGGPGPGGGFGGYGPSSSGHNWAGAGAGAGGPTPNPSGPPPPPPPHGSPPPPQSGPPPTPGAEKPKPSWQQRPQAEEQQQQQQAPPQPETSSKNAWEEAREQTRKKEAERKAKEAEQRRKDDIAKRIKELREKEAKERARREQEAKAKAAKEAQEREQREKEQREKAEAEARVKDQREKEQREKEQKEKAVKEKEQREARLRDARERDLRERLEREKTTRERLEKEAKEREAANDSTRKSTYAFSSVGEKLNPWPNGRPPPQPASSPATPNPNPSSAKRPPAPTAKTFTGTADEEAYSYRPYDQPKQHSRRRSGETVWTESSYAPSQSTARTSPPPSVRGTYSTKDPDKIMIRAVYGFMNQFAKTPASQLISGQGTVTDGLILRITTEGLFIDDDVRGVPQREWDVKAWTLKLMEVWCSSRSFAESTATATTKSPNVLHRVARARGDRGEPKTLIGEEADTFLGNMLRTCKNECRLCPHGDDASSNPGGLHVLRATIRDQEGKRYMFVLGEDEAWKVALGLQRLRKGTQVRQLGVLAMSAQESRNTLETLGWT